MCLTVRGAVPRSAYFAVPICQEGDGVLSMPKYCTLFLAAALLSACATVSQPSSALEPQPGDFAPSNFTFESGASLPILTLHYTTFGKPQFDDAGKCVNAVLLLHDTTGETAPQAGQFFTTPAMREALFAPGQPLDASRYYIIIPDTLGHGHSSKPSDGMRVHFPRYSESDAVEAQYRLVTDGLSIRHLKLVLGVAGGGSQAWLWGKRYPDMMDALMPIASAPIAQGGRAGLWQRMATQAIYTDPDWKEGNYVKQPKEWLNIVALSSLVERSGSNLQQAANSPEQVEKMVKDRIERAYKVWDANDALYALEASKKTPNLEPELSTIKARVYALYFEDDALQENFAQQMRPKIEQSPSNRVIEIQRSAQTDGHTTITRPEVWKTYIDELLTQSNTPARVARPTPKHFANQYNDPASNYPKAAAIPAARQQASVAPAQALNAEEIPLPSAATTASVRTATPMPLPNAAKAPVAPAASAPSVVPAAAPITAAAPAAIQSDAGPAIVTMPIKSTAQDKPDVTTTPNKENADISAANTPAANIKDLSTDTRISTNASDTGMETSTPKSQSIPPAAEESTTVWSSDPNLAPVSAPASPPPQNINAADAVTASPTVTSEPLTHAAIPAAAPSEDNASSSSDQGNQDKVASEDAAQSSAPTSRSFPVITQNQNGAKLTASAEEKASEPLSDDPVTANPAKEKAEPIAAAPAETVNNELPSPLPEVVKAPELPAPKGIPAPSEQTLDTASTPIPRPITPEK